jgi:hypothetical protein
VRESIRSGVSEKWDTFGLQVNQTERSDRDRGTEHLDEDAPLKREHEACISRAGRRQLIALLG